MNREEILKYLSEQKPEFRKKFGVTKLGLFGSFVAGNPHADSDIDIVVEMEHPDLFHLIGVKQIIEEHFKTGVDFGECMS